jgi:GNAT superfamily N-acetyltransferase
MPGYTVRPAQTADLDRLVDLLLALQDHLEAANPDLWQMKGDARDQLRSQIAARLTAANSCALVAGHARDGVVGMIFGRVVTNSRYIPDRAGIVDQVFVRADHRRSGVGSRLMAELCHFFAGEGVDDLSLRYVLGNEEAAGFWQALGFAPRIVTAGAARPVVEAQLRQTPGL